MTIPCPKCSGEGSVDLFPALAKAHQSIKALGSATISEIYAVIPDRKRITMTAVNRRVERLMEIRLVKRVAKSQPPRYQLV